MSPHLEGMEIIGDPACLHPTQAQVVEQFQEAFGKCPGAFLVAEACPVENQSRPMDLLMVHPEVGVLVVEVKAWSGRYINRVLGGWFHVLGEPKPRNPLDQAKRAMFTLQNVVKRKRPSQLPLFLAMVALANEASGGPHASEVPAEHFLFADDLVDPERLRLKVIARSREQAACARMLRPLEPEHLPLLRHVLGEISLEATWIEPKGLKASLDAAEMTDRCLSEEQKRLATLPVRSHPRLIRGVAGSGKTWVLSEMAARHLVRLQQTHENGLFPADRPPRVGVVCFNRGLVTHLRGQLERAYFTQTFRPLPDCLTVTHFESLRGEENGGYLAPVQKLPFPGRSTYQLKVLEETLRGNSEASRLPPFDALFVDEAQDLEPDDIRLLTRLLVPDPQTGEVSLVLFYDDAQNLYGKPRPLWKELGLDVARGDRTQVMTCCHRSPCEIIEMAFNVLLSSETKQGISEAKAFLDLQDLKARRLVVEEEGHFRLEFAPRHGDKPILRRFETWEAELEALRVRMLQLLGEGLRPEQVLVLAPVHLANKIYKAFKDAGFPEMNLVQRGWDPHRCPIEEGHLTISSVHQAKGLDAPVVLFAGLHALEDRFTRTIFYVGATRARHRLELSASGPSPLVDDIERWLAG